VVSRILERWRSAGWIETKRGRIKILQPAALQAQTGLIESGQNLSGSVTSSPKAKSASRRV
jgi:hypothetical protein